MYGFTLSPNNINNSWQFILEIILILTYGVATDKIRFLIASNSYPVMTIRIYYSYFVSCAKYLTDFISKQCELDFI